MKPAYLFAAKASSHLPRLERLISDLLDISKINAGKLIYNQTEFNFHEMLEESISSMQHTTDKLKIILKNRKIYYLKAIGLG